MMVTRVIDTYQGKKLFLVTFEICLRMFTVEISVECHG